MVVTIEKYGRVVTRHIWTEHFCKTSFLSATIYASKTGENIQALLFQNLRVFGTDCSQGNSLCHWQRSEHGGCPRDSADLTVVPMYSTPFFHTLLGAQSCPTWKKLTSYFRHSDLQAKLGSSLKQSVETRWNSTVDVLESVSQQCYAITTITLENS